MGVPIWALSGAVGLKIHYSLGFRGSAASDRRGATRGDDVVRNVTLSTDSMDRTNLSSLPGLLSSYSQNHLE